MSRMRELSLRVLNAGLISALSGVQRAFKSDAVYKVTASGVAAQFEGSWFSYKPSDFGATGNIDYSPEAENATREAIIKRLKGDEVFFDIGAHGGVYTITLQSRCPGIEVFSFEPQPTDLYANLQLNDLPSTRVFAVALGEQPGTVTMTTNSRSSNHVSDQGNLSVQMVRLDDFVEEKSLPNPHWIKIDIEGLELPALRGAERLLRDAKPTVICEINHLFDRYGTSISAFLDFMKSVGLSAHRLQGDELVEVGPARTLQDLGYSADNNFWFMPAR